MSSLGKQPSLKPQDLVVVIKLMIAPGNSPTFSDLGRQLHLSASEAHAATQRASMSRLLSKADRSIVVHRDSVIEFLLYGAIYAFPPAYGPMTRGLATGVSAAPLKQLFDQSGNSPWVWPDGDGDVYGPALYPLYALVPKACRQDSLLYGVLATFDALRAGAAREREAAKAELIKLLA